MVDIITGPELGDPDTGRERYDRVVPDDRRTGNGFTQTLANGVGGLKVGAWEEDTVFFASDPADKIVLTQRGDRPLADLLDNLVSKPLIRQAPKSKK